MSHIFPRQSSKISKKYNSVIISLVELNRKKLFLTKFFYLLFYIGFYISRYDFSEFLELIQHYLRKKFVTNFSFLMDSPNLTHKHTQTYTHTYIHTHIHTHTHTHNPLSNSKNPLSVMKALCQCSINF